MEKSGGIIALIAGILGLGAAAITLLFGGLGAAIKADGASSVIGLGWGGIFFCFLTIIFGAIAITAKNRIPGVLIIISSILGAYFGGTLVAVLMPGQYGIQDNADSVAMTQIISLAALNRIPTGLVPSYVEVIGDRNPIDPVAEWIARKQWDGVDRLEAFYATLQVRDGFPEYLKELLMYRWLISAVAAIKKNGFRSRGVLTLQGPQSIGKTAWVSALVPDPFLRESFVKLDHHLDAANKDTLLTAISHWIVEIGELDSSFRKDIARLKGFLTSDRDKVRKPYGRTDSEYPRRTVFCATVNENNFLIDHTGNSRWWTLPVTKIDYAHGIDMQQLFAQILVDLEKGEIWWLSATEEQELERYNSDHRNISAIRERVISALDLERMSQPDLPAMTATSPPCHIHTWRFWRGDTVPIRNSKRMTMSHLGSPPWWLFFQSSSAPKQINKGNGIFKHVICY